MLSRDVYHLFNFGRGNLNKTLYSGGGLTFTFSASSTVPCCSWFDMSFYDTPDQSGVNV